jgi:hypothetical protein
MKSVAFKGFNLQASPYKVIREDGLLTSPVLDIISFELARSDNAVSVYRKYRPRSFTLVGEIKATTEVELEQAIDQLKLNLLRQIGDVVVDWAGGYRYFNAECQNLIINRGTNDVTQCGWSAGFYMAVPFSTDNTTRDFMTAVTGQTAGTTIVSVNNIGTHLAVPYITLTITGLEPNTSDVSFTISNPESNESITITDEFADGDVVTIDTLNRQIFRGTELLAGVGNFPAWKPGAGLLQLSDTGSSRTISLAATYIARYL